MGQVPGQTRSAASLAVSIMSAIFLLLLTHLSALSQTAPAKRMSPVSLPDIVFVQAPEIVSGPLAQRFPRGSMIVRFHPSATNNLAHLTGGFFAAADPQISFDTTRILFSAQKTSTGRWQVWEINLDGSNPHQVTHCSDNCLRAAYLPAEEIVFTVEELQGTAPRSYLAVAKLDGSDLHRITFGSAPFQLETVLRDGRIVASAPWPLVGPEHEAGTRILYTLRPDGTGLESFRCDHSDNAVQTGAEELADGSLVFVRKPRADSAVAGELMQIRQGAASATPVVDRPIVYGAPRQISADQLVVAKQTPSAGKIAARFDLYRLNVKRGTLAERLYSDPQLSSIQPTPVIARTIPKHYWHTLNPQSSTGNFISLNSYLSADDPHGRMAEQISKVRVFTLRSTDGQERSLGDAPVEADGSFFVQIPANWPVRFVLLGANGQVLREERGWIWARPGEERGCGGCHGDKAVAPENHWPQTLRRFDTPTPLGD